MFQRLMILNIGLAALLVAGGVRLRRDWKAFGPAHNVAAIQPQPHTYPPLSTGRASTGPSADWTEIPSKDPFSFDRNDVDIVIAVAAVAPPPPPKPLGPKPVLFGTMSIGKNLSAMVAPGPAGRNFHEANVGESIDGWTIVGIGDRSIEIESDGVHQTVKTSDAATLVSRDPTRSVSATAPVVQAPIVSVPAPTAEPTATAAPAAPGALSPAPPGYSYVNGIFGTKLLLPDK